MNFWKPVWWFVLFASATCLLTTRFNSVSSQNPTPFDIGLIGLLVVLILLPFVSEVSAFGFTVKKHIEEVKQELKQDIRDETQAIRNEIFTLQISNRLTSHVVVQTVPNPPPDSELSAIREQISNLVTEFQEQRGIQDLQPPTKEISQNTIYAFQQRYAVEREIKRIWDTRVRDSDFYRYPSFGRMVDDITRFQLIAPNLGGYLKEIYSVASSAVHGEEPSQEKIDFLREVTPGILATLNSIK